MRPRNLARGPKPLSWHELRRILREVLWSVMARRGAKTTSTSGPGRGSACVSPSRLLVAPWSAGCYADGLIHVWSFRPQLRQPKIEGDGVEMGELGDESGDEGGDEFLAVAVGGRGTGYKRRSPSDGRGR